RALREARPTGTREFFSLAAAQVRRELLDLARHYYGPHGDGAHHRSTPAAESGTPLYERADESQEPGRLAEWCEVHRHNAGLRDAEGEVVDLVFYHGLSQVEAAEVLGVTPRTIQRRWQSALLRLHPVLKGGMPG